MICYLCSLEAGQERRAIGVCKCCGAGICRSHLVETLTTPPIGMGTDIHTRYSLLCRRCYTTTTPPTRLPRNRTHEPDEKSVWSERKWWHWLFKRKPATLPEPEEAVSTVELFLKQQRKQ